MTEKPRTPADTIHKAAQTAVAAGLKHVYIGNMDPGDFGHTWCPSCGKKLIERQGLSVLSNKIDETGKCGFCGAKIKGIWR